jgi:hypothetical protein
MAFVNDLVQGAFYDTVREPRMNQQTAIVAQESETIPTGQISALEVNQVLKVMPTLENQVRNNLFILLKLKILYSWMF